VADGELQEGTPMTESEWLECDDPTKMLKFLHCKASDRKLRLFACACARARYGFEDRYESEHAVAEAFADGEVSRQVVYELWGIGPSVGLSWPDVPKKWAKDMSRPSYPAMRQPLVMLARCVFPSPFRGVSVNHAWLTDEVGTMARSAYTERHLPSGQLDPDRLAVLSDALEEAGCDDEDILSHLRSPGPHVRGCWALDLLRGKE
jgi:hypothetical protein